MKRTICIIFLLGVFSLIGYTQHRQPDNNKLLELYQSQQYKEAAEYLKSFYPDTVTDLSVLSRLAYCYRMAGDYRLAEQYYLQLHALDSLDIPTLLNLAVVNAQRGLLKPSAAYYQKVIVVDSTHIQAYVALSSIMKRLGDGDAAFSYLERANQLQPTNSDIAFDFAQMCMNLREESGYRRADSVLQTALQADADNGLLVLGKAQVAEKLKNYLEVVERCEQLLECGEETQQVLTLLARGYFHINDFIGCKDAYEKAIERYETVGELDYYYLAMTYKSMKHYKEGLECMDKVLELAISPNAALYYGRKADLHDLANQPSAAASNYLRSFQFDVIPIHYYSLAVLYDKKLTDPRNALRYYRLYLKQELDERDKVFVEYVQKRIKELE